MPVEDDKMKVAQLQQLDREEDTIRDVTTVWVDSPEIGTALVARVADGDPPESFTSRAAEVLRCLSLDFPATDRDGDAGYSGRLAEATRWSLQRLRPGQAPSMDEAAVIRRAILPTLVGRLRGFAGNEEARKLIKEASSEIGR